MRATLTSITDVLFLEKMIINHLAQVIVSEENSHRVSLLFCHAIPPVARVPPKGMRLFPFPPPQRRPICGIAILDDKPNAAIHPRSA